jgi:adenylate cyclase
MQRLHDLVGRYAASADGAERQRLEGEVWARYGVERAVMVLDSQGFSRRTQRDGLVAALAAVARLRLLLTPLVAGAGGEVVKLEADNLFAVFPDVPAALAAARALRLRLDEAKRLEAQPLDACLGIDSGRILLLPGQELFGDAVNVAAKLGEDVATDGEIWLSGRAYAQVEPRPPAEARALVLSGLEMVAYRLDPG